MSRLGIEYQNGLIFEGRDDPSNLAVPAPIVSQCALIESSADLEKLPLGMGTEPFRWIFREDSFDPVSRVRRGRLFQHLGGSTRESVAVVAHPYLLSDISRSNVDGRVRTEMTVFIHCTQLVSRPDRGEGLQLAIGHSGAYSLWRILQTEQTVHQDVLVTLRAESAYGVLPTLDMAQIPEDGRRAVTEAYARVMNVAYRDSPTRLLTSAETSVQFSVLVGCASRQETTRRFTTTLAHVYRQ